MELLRIPLPRTPVHKGKREGPEHNAPTLLGYAMPTKAPSNQGLLPARSPVGLSSGRRAWRSEDVKAVSRRDGDEPLHVRRSLKRWRHNTLRGWLADLSDEPLELTRLEANKGFPSMGQLRDERVGHPFGTES
jgi:hypothetical protein